MSLDKPTVCHLITYYEQICVLADLKKFLTQIRAIVSCSTTNPSEICCWKWSDWML